MTVRFSKAQLTCYSQTVTAYCTSSTTRPTTLLKRRPPCEPMNIGIKERHTQKQSSASPERKSAHFTSSLPRSLARLHSPEPERISKTRTVPPEKDAQPTKRYTDIL